MQRGTGLAACAIVLDFGVGLGLGKAALVELHVNKVVVLAVLRVFLDVARIHYAPSLWLTYLLWGL